MLNQKGIVWMPIIIWSAIILLTGTVAVKEKLITIDLSGNGLLIQKVAVTPAPLPDPDLKLIIPSSDPSYTPIPTHKPTKPVYVDPDPIEPCTSKYSGDSIKVRRSECQNKYIDCQINNTWKVLTKDDCTKQQTGNNSVNNYPPCVVYYPALGYSRTYNYTSPSDCSYWQERAKTSTQPLLLPEIKAAPLPTIEPYKPSQEYTDTYNKNMQEINKEWKPTQFVAPTPVPAPDMTGFCYGNNCNTLPIQNELK